MEPIKDEIKKDIRNCEERLTPEINYLIEKYRPSKVDISFKGGESGNYVRGVKLTLSFE